jgi:sugar phosphate isomerase/epimerase
MSAGRKLALATLTLLDAAPPDLVDAAAAAGLDGVTVRIGTAYPGDAPPLETDESVRDATLARLRATGLGVLDVEVLRLGPDTDMGALDPILDRAAALGAEHLLVTNDDPDDAASARRFAELCELCAPRGLRPALEFMAFRGTKTVEQAHRVVTAAEHPAGVVLVDALHLARSGGTPADVARVAERDPERFTYTQLCDAPLAAPPDGFDGLRREGLVGRLLPGDGELPLVDLLRALPPSVAISIEAPVEALRSLPDPELAKRAATATREVLASVD